MWVRGEGGNREKTRDRSAPSVGGACGGPSPCGRGGARRAHTWNLLVELKGISQTLGKRSRYPMALPSVSSENLSSAVSDASPITMRWKRGLVSGASLAAPSPRFPRSPRGSHLGHRHRVLAGLEGSAVAQGEHAA